VSHDPDRTNREALDAIGRFISASRHSLAKQLVVLRKGAALTQEELAERTGFSRSTVANAEGGHKRASREFWQAADKELRARGVLLAKHKDLEEAMRRYGEHAADEAERTLIAERTDRDQHLAYQPNDATLSAVIGAGLRISTAVLDLLSAVGGGIESGSDPTD
jgi:transcriptional regulator with XRE-family HTH domain